MKSLLFTLLAVALSSSNLFAGQNSGHLRSVLFVLESDHKAKPQVSTVISVEPVREGNATHTELLHFSLRDKVPSWAQFQQLSHVRPSERQSATAQAQTSYTLNLGKTGDRERDLLRAKALREYLNAQSERFNLRVAVVEDEAKKGRYVLKSEEIEDNNTHKRISVEKFLDRLEAKAPQKGLFVRVSKALGSLGNALAGVEYDANPARSDRRQVVRTELAGHQLPSATSVGSANSAR